MGAILLKSRDLGRDSSVFTHTAKAGKATHRLSSREEHGRCGLCPLRARNTMPSSFSSIPSNAIKSGLGKGPYNINHLAHNTQHIKATSLAVHRKCTQNALSAAQHLQAGFRLSNMYVGGKGITEEGVPHTFAGSIPASAREISFQSSIFSFGRYRR
jgi:hypothetical protein